MRWLREEQLLCPRPHLLRPGPDVLRSRAGHVLCPRAELLPIELLQIELWPIELLQEPLPPHQVLQEPLQQVLQRSGPELLCSRADLLCSGPELLCSGCADLRRSSRVLQLIA